MSQTLLEMAKDLVLAQINTKHLTPDSIQGALHSTYETLQRLETSASPGENGHGHGAAQGLGSNAEVDWKSSITRHSVRCLECGETFKQLSLRHLSLHDLGPRSYRAKYNIGVRLEYVQKPVTGPHLGFLMLAERVERGWTPP